MQIPVTPSFTAGESPAPAKLGNLAAAVSATTQVPIVCSLKTYPLTTAVPAQGIGTVQWGTKETDTDGMFSASSPTLITAQTPGYYHVHAVISASVVASSKYETAAQITYGPINPNGTAGSSVYFLESTSGYVSASSGDSVSLNLSGMTPFMYAGDSISIILACSSAVTVSNSFAPRPFTQASTTDTAGNRDGASAFQCYWVASGP